MKLKFLASFLLALLMLQACHRDSDVKPDFSKVSLEIYRPDSNTPLETAQVSSPQVWNTITLKANAPSSLQGIKVFLDEDMIGEFNAQSPQLTYDTRLIADGQHTMKLKYQTSESSFLEQSIQVQNNLINFEVMGNIFDIVKTNGGANYTTAMISLNDSTGNLLGHATVACNSGCRVQSGPVIIQSPSSFNGANYTVSIIYSTPDASFNTIRTYTDIPRGKFTVNAVPQFQPIYYPYPLGYVKYTNVPQCADQYERCFHYGGFGDGALYDGLLYNGPIQNNTSGEAQVSNNEFTHSVNAGRPYKYYISHSGSMKYGIVNTQLAEGQTVNIDFAATINKPLTTTTYQLSTGAGSVYTYGLVTAGNYDDLYFLGRQSYANPVILTLPADNPFPQYASFTRWLSDGANAGESGYVEHIVRKNEKHGFNARLANTIDNLNLVTNTATEQMASFSIGGDINKIDAVYGVWIYNDFTATSGGIIDWRVYGRPKKNTKISLPKNHLPSSILNALPDAMNYKNFRFYGSALIAFDDFNNYEDFLSKNESALKDFTSNFQNNRNILEYGY